MSIDVTVSGLDTSVDVNIAESKPTKADIAEASALGERASVSGLNTEVDVSRPDGRGIDPAMLLAFRGEKGDDGTDGFSPTARVDKVGDTATITITDKYGTTTATITDGGGSGVSSYDDLEDKPQIEGVTLEGNKTFPQLNLNVLTNSEIQDIFDNLL